jgi:ABC-type uncharacterized transport system substrate-binding protein
MRVIGLAVVLAVSLVLAPLAAEAQGGKVARIGILTTSFSPGGLYLTALRQGLGDFGYVEGQNIALEIRSADGRPERLPGLAGELVRLKVDVIVAPSNAAIATAQKATTSIPIVMTNVSDPVAAGFVASLARPGGNITGLTIQAPDVIGKALQLRKDAVPGLSRVAVLWIPACQAAAKASAKWRPPPGRWGCAFSLWRCEAPTSLMAPSLR